MFHEAKVELEMALKETKMKWGGSDRIFPFSFFSFPLGPKK